MAIRALMLKKKLDVKRSELDALLQTGEELEKREAELEQAINEAETEEERSAVEEAVESFESDKAEFETAKGDLEKEISGLEGELEEEERSQNNGPVQPATEPESPPPTLLLSVSPVPFARNYCHSRKNFVPLHINVWRTRDSSNPRLPNSENRRGAPSRPRQNHFYIWHFSVCSLRKKRKKTLTAVSKRPRKASSPKSNVPPWVALVSMTISSTNSRRFSSPPTWESTPPSK